MKALALKVRDSICDGEFCHTISQIFLISFGFSVIWINLAQLA